MNVNVDIDLDVIAYNCGREEAEELVILIDQRQEDWEFTEKMARYFMGEMKKFHEESVLFGERRTLQDFLESVISGGENAKQETP